MNLARIEILPVDTPMTQTPWTEMPCLETTLECGFCFVFFVRVELDEEKLKKYGIKSIIYE